MQLQPNTLLQGGKYRIVKTLGQGGFGITYLAMKKIIDKDDLGEIETWVKVTIKEFFMKEHCDRDTQTSHVSVPLDTNRDLVDKFKAKFIKEAHNISKLKHDNIIKVQKVFEENNTAYYVMEYIEGGSLSDRINSYGAMSETEALHYTRQIASALQYIHSRNIVHLDVKPGNILIKEDTIAILIDFGLAKQYDQSGSQTSSTPVGISNGYAPMEQYKMGGVSTFSPATDIYSLGATLFKLVTGDTPPHATDVNNYGLPELPDTLSPATKRAITAAMQSRIMDRPQSIETFLTLLSGAAEVDEETEVIRKEEEIQVVEHEPIVIPASTPTPKPVEPVVMTEPIQIATPKKKRKFTSIIATVVVAVIVFGGGMLLLGSDKDKKVFTKEDYKNMGSPAACSIPNSVTSIEDEALSYCDALTSISIPSSVTAIGDEAFYSCGALTSISIPNSVTSIGYMAFGFCYALTSISIPNSVTSIGVDAFAYCSALKSIYVSPSSPVYNQLKKEYGDKVKIKPTSSTQGETATDDSVLSHVVDSLSLVNKDMDYLKKRTEQEQTKADKAERLTEELGNMAEQGSKLSAHSISIQTLNYEGKEVSRAKLADRLRVDFTISANKFAESGNVTVYIRIISPDGFALSHSDVPTFEIDGEISTYSASSTVNYQNIDLPVSVYYDAKIFNKGTYRVELYANGYQIANAKVNVE